LRQCDGPRHIATTIFSGGSETGEVRFLRREWTSAYTYKQAEQCKPESRKPTEQPGSIPMHQAESLPADRRKLGDAPPSR
jgi:hypothetical protein